MTKLLLISGVNISAPAASNGDSPTPDYAGLIDTFQPDIIDTRSVAASSCPTAVFARRWLGSQWAIAFAALACARRYQAVIATGEDVGLRLALLLKVCGVHVPLLMTCHNIATRRPSFFLGKLRVGSPVHLFQCLSRAQAQMLGERFGVRAEQIALLYWHVDHTFFRPMTEVTMRQQLCSAGMASRDYATLIAATRDLDVDVKIAADSPWFKQQLNISADKLPARVEVRSYGSYSALRQLYAESLFVVVPLLDVPFSAGYTVILEAMAMGKAVIVSRIRQQDDFVVDGWNGLYVTPGNPSELRRRIQYLLENPDEARRLGANARKTVEDRFTLGHYVQRMGTAVQGVTLSAAARRDG